VPLADGKDDTYSMNEISEGVGEAAPSPAFAPTPPKPNCIQIWSFAVSGESGGQVLDTNTPPRLHLGICTDWGDIKYFKWCPTQGPNAVVIADSIASFGLLAGIWGDGKLRVLDVEDREGQDIPIYSKTPIL
jgi:transcription factor C subunit 6